VLFDLGIDYDHGGSLDWANTRRFGPQVIRVLWETVARRDVYFNVNMPFCPTDAVTGIRVLPFQRFSRSPMAYYPSDNVGKFFIAIPETPTPLDPANDFHAVVHGNAVSVTPLMLDIADQRLVDEMALAFGN
jgi:5'-nucleotidase